MTTRFIELVGEISRAMPQHVVDLAVGMLNDEGKPVRHARILRIGVSYRADVGALRESPALEVVRALHQRGAQLVFIDPYVDRIEILGVPIKKVMDVEGDSMEVDLGIVLTGHSCVDYCELASTLPMILDTCNATHGCDGGRIVRLGTGDRIGVFMHELDARLALLTSKGDVGSVVPKVWKDSCEGSSQVELG